MNEDQSAIVEIFQALLNRSCPLILNKTNVPQLLKLSKTAKGRRRNASTQRGIIARELLKEISTTYPTMYTAYMKDILQEIMSDNDSACKFYNMPDTIFFFYSRILFVIQLKKVLKFLLKSVRPRMVL